MACSVPHSDDGAKEPKLLRSLTSLNWPFVPEESAFPDPLKRDDPKPLQLRHYEAIGALNFSFLGTCISCSSFRLHFCHAATSPAVRAALARHPSIPSLLASLDQLKGFEREHAIQRALGMTEADISEQSRGPVDLSEEVRGLRELAEAVELAVRGGQDGALGLDWDTSAD
jgi:hypothetical protein